MTSGVRGIFSIADGITSTLVDNTMDLQGFGGLALNNQGDIAFLARLKSGAEGIFVGPYPATDKVVAVGDDFFGGVIAELGLMPDSLSDNGEIAFYARLSDGRRVLAVATPVPEPGTYALLLSGLFLVALASNLRGRRRQGV